MASAADVLFVTDNIESNYLEKGWTDVMITDRLDSGALKERVVATYWRMRASATIQLVNMSESGSSRGLDAIYARMNALAESWEAKAVALETPTEESSASRLSSFPIKRV